MKKKARSKTQDSQMIGPTTQNSQMIVPTIGLAKCRKLSGMGRFALAVGLTVCAFMNCSAFADEEENAKPAARSGEHQMILRRRTADDVQQLKPEEMLSDLRDTRLSIGQVKQQAVNLFLEATRTVVKPGDQALHFSPTEINAAMLSEKKKYMEPRKDWLVFYINTMEPIIQLLTDDINDVDTNGRKVPPNVETKINPLWKTWKSDVRAINKALDELQELIGPDSGTNIPLAKTALTIYSKALDLEKIRYRAYELMSQEYLSMEHQKPAKHSR